MKAKILYLILALICLGLSNIAQAADIALQLHVSAFNDQVSVTISNLGKDPAEEVNVTVELDGQIYSQSANSSLESRKTANARFAVRYPRLQGSYPLITRVSYKNDGQVLEALNVGLFNHGRAERAAGFCNLRDIQLRDQAEVIINCGSTAKFRLILPSSIEVTPRGQSSRGTHFGLKNKQPLFRTTHTVYLALETDLPDGAHATSLIQSRLTTFRYVKYSSLFSTSAYLWLALGGLVISALGYKLWLRQGSQAGQVWHIAIVRAAFSIFVVGGLFFVFRTARVIPDIASRLIDFNALSQFPLGRFFSGPLNSVLGWLYFEGNDYDKFTEYVADPLFIYFLIGNIWVLRFLIKPNPTEDRYWHLMLTIFSIPKSLVAWSKFHWSPQTRLAILTLMVKAFYVPLLSSWCLNNIPHLLNLYNQRDLNFRWISEILISGMIFIDVTFFAFGYLVELPQLKNKIRSVEPTLFGWVVCIMCYPPFNNFTFRLYDVPLNESWAPAGAIPSYIAGTAVILLWGIYVWATIALGFKCSNLTNRGIVSKGPYKYVRHPAYAAKTSLWGIQGLFLSEKNFFLAVSLAGIYALRAWTEERHLSRDPEYVEYKKKVPWMFFPKII